MSKPEILRTSDAAFYGIPDYPFAPKYCDIVDIDLGSLRQHYIDEGDGPIVLLMHGEPTWSYLYRKMVHPLANAGFRVIVPDLIGFGKSDKPSDIGFFSYARHVTWLRAFLDALALRDIHLFCQDWGGLLSLRLVAAQPERFAKVCAANTALPVGTGMSEAFSQWREFSRSSPEFDIGKVVQMGAVRTLSDAEVAAYNAPFESEAHKASARAFPSLVPVDPMIDGAIDNLAAWKSLRHFNKPFLTLFSDKDPITAGGEAAFQTGIDGAKGQSHEKLQGGGHFLQEDLPDALCKRLIAFCQ